MNHSGFDTKHPHQPSAEMPQDEVSRRYGWALVEAGIEPSGIERLNAYFRLCPALFDTLQSPVFSACEKRALIDRVFSGEEAPLRNFLKVLVENGRMDRFSQIVAAYTLCWYRRQGIAAADVSYVFEPSQQELNEIRQAVLALTQQKDAKLFFRQDETLLGGLVLKIGDMKYDSSVKGSLRELKRALKAR